MQISLWSLANQFDPTAPLPPGDPRYVECATERHVPTLMAKFGLPLSRTTPAALLFSGQIGDGKTSTLNYLRGQREAQGDFVAYGQADLHLDLSRVHFEHVILLLLAIVERSLKDRFAQSLEKPWYVRLWQEFCRIANLPVELRFDVKVGPFLKITTNVKDSPDMNRVVLEGLRKTAGDTFLSMANEYLAEARKVVREETGGDLVAILDELDRITARHPTGEYMDEAIFINHAYQLKTLECKVIYTVRLPTVRAGGPDLPIMYGSPPIFVPMLAVRGRDGQTQPAGLQRLREILALRIRAELGAFGGDPEGTGRPRGHPPGLRDGRGCGRPLPGQRRSHA
jgi:hypothetical protein